MVNQEHLTLLEQGVHASNQRENFWHPYGPTQRSRLRSSDAARLMRKSLGHRREANDGTARSTAV